MLENSLDMWVHCSVMRNWAWFRLNILHRILIKLTWRDPILLWQCRENRSIWRKKAFILHRIYPKEYKIWMSGAREPSACMYKTILHHHKQTFSCHFFSIRFLEERVAFIRFVFSIYPWLWKNEHYHWHEQKQIQNEKNQWSTNISFFHLWEDVLCSMHIIPKEYFFCPLHYNHVTV